MTKWLKKFCITIALIATFPAFAALNVLATAPEWGALVTEIGGESVKVSVATTALQDVHRIEAKPSLLAAARNADLLIATGAELESGWLPVLMRESGNAKIQTGANGYFEAAQQVHLIDVPASVDRAQGDVHALGNPHIQLDPRNIALIGNALAKRLGEIDSVNRDAYAARNQKFQEKLKSAIGKWESAAAPLKGAPVIVHHADQAYLLRWLGLKEVGALEAKPGVPPSTGHLSDLLNKLQTEPAKMILTNAYNDPKPAKWLGERSKIAVVTLPFSVGGSKEAKDIFSLFDDTINKLMAGSKQ